MSSHYRQPKITCSLNGASLMSHLSTCRILDSGLSRRESGVEAGARQQPFYLSFYITWSFLGMLNAPSASFARGRPVPRSTKQKDLHAEDRGG